MGADEIIAELPRLSPTELAQVRAKLRELVEPVQVDVRAVPTAARRPRVYSPRLARPEQAADFAKRVVELAPDAEV